MPSDNSLLIHQDIVAEGASFQNGDWLIFCTFVDLHCRIDDLHSAERFSHPMINTYFNCLTSFLPLVTR